MIRARLILIALMAVVIALGAGRVFDRTQFTLVAAALVPSVAALVMFGRNRWIAIAVLIASVPVAVALVVLAEGGAVPAGLYDALVAGPRRLLSTDWPSPERPDVIGAVAGFVASGTALAAGLVLSSRWHLLPLVPISALSMGVIALSAPGGPDVLLVVTLALLGAVFAVLQGPSSAGDRFRALLGERSIAPLVIVGALVAISATAVVTLTERADPRRNDPASSTEPAVDPIESTVALRNLEPARTLVTIDDIKIDGVSAAGSVGADGIPIRWRLAALDTYDGRRWSPTLTLREIGVRLNEPAEESLTATLTYESGDLELVPLPGPPIIVETRVETDDGRTVVRPVVAPRANSKITFESALAPSLATARDRRTVPAPIDEVAAGFTELAERLAGADGPILERLGRIESRLRQDWALDSGAPGAGQQLALIERFATDTQRGSAEQFVTTFVLLARALGVEARVATGFIVDPGEDANPLVLRSSDAAAWPEVHIEEIGWVAFDPVPDAETADDAEPATPPQVQTPAAPQPPIAPPTDTGDDDEVVEELLVEEASAIDLALKWVGRGALAASAVLFPLLTAVFVIIGAKLRRRRRRLSAPDPADRIRGAWAVATDGLVDAGLTISPAWTDREIAMAGAPIVPQAQRHLARLGAMSSAATFASHVERFMAETEAVAALNEFERAIKTEFTRRERLRWWMSLRSLRQASRSPVLGDV